MGYEVAGTVAEVGDGVEGVAVGDRVMAGTHFGGHAEQVVVSADDVVPLPDALSFEQGAAIPVNYATAWAGLVGYGSLQPGERVLVHAAAGGVGHRRHADRQAPRRGGLRDRVARQARRDPRLRRRPPPSTTRRSGWEKDLPSST